MAMVVFITQLNLKTFLLKRIKKNEETKFGECEN